jgi:hypothetical protein
MTRIQVVAGFLRQGPLFLILCLAACPAMSAPAGDDLLDQVLKDSSSQKNSMESQSVRTPDFDNWLRHYLAGQSDLAQKDWGKVLKVACKEGDMHSLLKQAVIRISFSNSTDDNPRCNTVLAVNTMIADTEKYIGKNDWFLHDGYDYATNICQGAKKFDQATAYKQKEIKLEEKRYGIDSPILRGTLCHLAELFIEKKNWPEAERALNRVDKVNRDTKDKKITRRVQILRTHLPPKNVDTGQKILPKLNH